MFEGASGRGCQKTGSSGSSHGLTFIIGSGDP